MSVSGNQEFRMKFRDRGGDSYEIRTYDDSKDREKLIEMYESFSPAQRCLGLPPTTRKGIENWVKYLAENGISFVAERDGRIVGHVVLVPTEDGREVDVTIFIHQDFQNRGLGQELMRIAIDFAKKRRYKGMMLVTERANRRAIHVYEKLGFRVVDLHFEYDMFLRLD
jgi:ribosomal protein S18 acetylase RimI-like enzyme